MVGPLVFATGGGAVRYSVRSQEPEARAETALRGRWPTLPKLTPKIRKHAAFVQ